MNLTGELLIAMPGIGDSRFGRSVILICSHDDEGVMGLILNKPMPDLYMPALLKQMDIGIEDATPSSQIYSGGPVETGRGFVLHSPNYMAHKQTIQVRRGIAMTATQDVLRVIAKGQGPTHHRIMLGYAGWGIGQLEEEIADNGWLTCTANTKLVFKTEPEAMWQAAMGILGVDTRMLSGAVGRA